MVYLPKTPKDILIILFIIVLGVVLVNQTLGYIYKAEFLKTPCKLCEELNPQLEECFSKPKFNFFSNGTLMDLSIKPLSNS